MKIILTRSIILTMLFALFGYAQTAFTDSGTVDKTDPGKIVITFAGTVRTTGALSGKVFEIPPGYRLYTETPLKLTGADSIKITVKLRGYWQSKYGSPGWVDLITIYSSDTDSIQQCERDTLLLQTANYYQLYVNGETGNSHTPATTFEGDIEFIKEE